MGGSGAIWEQCGHVPLEFSQCSPQVFCDEFKMHVVISRGITKQIIKHTDKVSTEELKCLLVCLSIYNKIPQTGWLTQQKVVSCSSGDWQVHQDAG